MNAISYPVSVRATLQPQLSRWLWLVKWLLVLPHYVVLAFLWLAYLVLTAVALVAIVFSGRYPRSIFDFNVGVLRWSWRVAYYASGGLGTDRYPPFSLESRPDYPADLEVAYPEHLSRGLALVKWWLLAVPHYLVLGFFLGGGWYVASDTLPGPWSLGLIELLVVFAGVVLLVTGTYPRTVFDLVLGLNRWVIRVTAYASLMTDVYPPFRLDQGSAEPAGALVVERSAGGSAAGSERPGPTPSPGTLPPAPPPSPGRPWRAGRMLAVMAGSLAVLTALGLLIAGLGLRITDAAARDADGFLTGAAVRVHSDGHAVVSEDIEVQTGTAVVELPERLVGEVKIEADAGARDVFVGVADSDDVRAYLSGVAYSTVVSVEEGRTATYDVTDGPKAPVPPDAVDIWDASAAGPGRQTLVLMPEEGEWTVVVMTPDGSAPVDADVRVGAAVPGLDDLAYVFLVTGLLLGSCGALGLWLALRRPNGPPRRTV